jgi:septum formation protein
MPWHTVVGVTSPARLVLASASPARLRTLRSAGVEPEVVVSGVDESTVDASTPQELCVMLARLKAEAVMARLHADPDRAGGAIIILGCDSVLEFDGEMLGKPVDADDAIRRWRRMRGASGVLHTGHCVIDAGTGKRAEATASTIVHFGNVSDDEIAAYVRTGEPLRVAGGFTIDGLGGWFVEGVEGDAGTVIGLSLPLLRRLLGEIGTSPTGLWGDPLLSAG